jgi:hypothetical protein
MKKKIKRPSWQQRQKDRIKYLEDCLYDVLCDISSDKATYARVMVMQRRMQENYPAQQRALDILIKDADGDAELVHNLFKETEYIKQSMSKNDIKDTIKLLERQGKCTNNK